jgi:hypothetical protein
MSKNGNENPPQNANVEIANALKNVATTAIFVKSWDKRLELEDNKEIKLAEYKTLERIELAKVKEDSFQFIVRSLANDDGYTYERAIETAYRFDKRHQDLNFMELKFKNDRESLDYEVSMWKYNYFGCGLLIGIIIAYALIGKYKL